MVLSKKPDQPSVPGEYGHFRTKAVAAMRGRSARYYGAGWSRDDPNYGGEVYVNGHRGTPVKFHDARILMSKCKFVFCLENLHDPHYSLNYVTEKIFHGFLSASVPIYCGAWNVEHVIDPDLFIDVRKYNYDLSALLDACEKMPENEYQGYLDRIGKFLEGRGQKFTCEYRFKELDQKLFETFG